jgi:hypothetical protein
MGNMAQFDTDPAGSNLPMVIMAQSAVRSFARLRSNADFVSQLLAARQNLSPQRARRRAPVDVALAAYREGDSRGVRRLPSGSYRRLDV